MPKPKEGQVDLAAEQRRRNVREVREAAEELRQIENALSDVLARTPAVLARVQAIRARIARATGGGGPDEDTEEEPMEPR